jgi:hypothetical protein
MSPTSAPMSSEKHPSDVTVTTNEDANADVGATNITHKQPRQVVSSLLGSHVVCTLRDGRKASGTLVCVDRL